MNPPLDDLAGRRWDAEYSAGRYRHEPQVDFVDVIVRCIDACGIERRGVYVGCGNGRNYLPLVARGLDLVGLDVSAEAISQLRLRAPERAESLVHGDLSGLPQGERYPLIIGIQVFQHGDVRRAREHLREAQRRLAQGGLFCLRVNAEGTDVEAAHRVTERDEDGFTVRYLTGAKRGLDIHFFGRRELEKLFQGYECIVAPQKICTQRVPASRGEWCQWEAIWRKPNGGL